MEFVRKGEYLLAFIELISANIWGYIWGSMCYWEFGK